MSQKSNPTDKKEKRQEEFEEKKDEEKKDEEKKGESSANEDVEEPAQEAPPQPGQPFGRFDMPGGPGAQPVSAPQSGFAPQGVSEPQDFKGAPMSQILNFLSSSICTGAGGLMFAPMANVQGVRLNMQSPGSQPPQQPSSEDFPDFNIL